MTKSTLLGAPPPKEGCLGVRTGVRTGVSGDFLGYSYVRLLFRVSVLYYYYYYFIFFLLVRFLLISSTVFVPCEYIICARA